MTLQSMLGDTAYRALNLLADAESPMSGRMVASALDVSPTTATSLLGKLRQAGLAVATREGRADRWRLNADNAVLGTWLSETRGAGSALARPRGRVVILTALPEEYQAVAAHLKKAQSDRAGQTRYETGEFGGTHIDWTVHVAEIGMGNASASAELVTAQATFDPDIVLFVGVAGSVKPDDLCRGDVVVGSQAYNIHAGKDIIDDTGRAVSLARPIGPAAPYGLVQLAKAVRRRAWTTEVQLVSPGDEVVNVLGGAPRVVINAIAAGEIVHRNLNSPLMERIRTMFNNVAAVDMESHGLYEAAHHLGVPALAVRGISDSVGDKTAVDDKRWQPTAAAHAAGFAFALLREAEAQDLGICSTLSPPAVGPTGTGDRLDDALFQLPPAVAIAYEAAARSDAEEATALVMELAAQGDQPAAPLDEIRRTTPLRFTGVGSAGLWLIVAAYADSHDHPTASWLYQQAAEHSSDGATQALLYGRAALMTARRGNPEQALHVIDSAALLRPAARWLWELHRAVVRDDGPGLLAAARRLAPALDLGFLDAALSDASLDQEDDRDPALEEFFHDLAAVSPELLEQLRYLVALWAGMALQMTGQLAAAQLLFEMLNLGMPSSRPQPGSTVRGSLIGPRTATVILQLATTLCARVADPAGKEPGFDIDRALSNAFHLAMTARDRILDWHGPTSEALAIAALALSQAGDPKGALRLLLPPPQGTARPQEATAQRVVVLAAELAASTQQLDTAFDLAKRIEDPIERHIATGLAYLIRKDCEAEAVAEFRQALHDPVANSRPDQQVRALLALSLVEEPTDDEIRMVEGFDRQIADLIRAQALATAGRTRQAQMIARRYPSSEAATQIRVLTLLDGGGVSKAIEALENHARQHNDERFLIQAATLAHSYNQNAEAERLAGLLAGSIQPYRRRIGREILVDTATRRKDWSRVLVETRRLTQDTELAERDPDRPEHLLSYRWAAAQAHYQLRQFAAAYEAIRDEPPLKPPDATRARLVLAVLHFLAPSIHARDADGSGSSTVVTQAEVLARLTSIAQAFPDDEELVAAAVMTSLRLPVTEPVDPGQLARARALQEQFFGRFPDSKLIRRVEIKDTVADVTELLREHLAPGADQVIRMRRAAWAGQVPISVVTTSVHRSYAEGLIKDALSCYPMLSGDPQVVLAEIAEAQERLNQAVVIDTSTLFLADAAFGDCGELRSRFERWVLSDAQRDDVLAARVSLQMTGPFSMGWDPYTNRPTMHETDEATMRRWTADADRLAAALVWCEIAQDPPDDEDSDSRLWSSPIRIARDRGLPLLADDAALRATARNEGVPAFSSFAVLQALVASGEKDASLVDQAYRRLMKSRVAELPLLDRIGEIASEDDWSPTSYAAFLLARPTVWMPQERGLAIYMDLVQAMPAGRPTDLALWCSTALHGLCQTIAPEAVPAATSSVMAWTVLTTRQPELLPRFLEVCPRIIVQFAGETDVLRDLMLKIIQNLRLVVPAEHVAGMLLPLLGELDEENRSRAVQIFLTAP